MKGSRCRCGSKKGFHSRACLRCVETQFNESATQRFMARVEKDPNTECWQWVSTFDARHYGLFTARRGGGQVKAHRWSYERFVGPAGDLLVHHKCVNTSCVNPAHLEAVAVPEHGLRHQREVCQRGHRMTAENTYLRPDGTGRNCRECIRLRSSKTYQAHVREYGRFVLDVAA